MFLMFSFCAHADILFPNCQRKPHLMMFSCAGSRQERQVLELHLQALSLRSLSLWYRYIVCKTYACLDTVRCHVLLHWSMFALHVACVLKGRSWQL